MNQIISIFTVVDPIVAFDLPLNSMTMQLMNPFCDCECQSIANQICNYNKERIMNIAQFIQPCTSSRQPIQINYCEKDNCEALKNHFPEEILKNRNSCYNSIKNSEQLQNLEPKSAINDTLAKSIKDPQNDNSSYHSRHRDSFIDEKKDISESSEVMKNSKESNHAEEEYFKDEPRNFKVKAAKKACLTDYKFSTCYKYNKASGRNLRYYVCDYQDSHTEEKCGRFFNKTWNFIDHVRIHTGVKPFECEICQRSFAQKGNLNKHKKLHLVPE